MTDQAKDQAKEQAKTWMPWIGAMALAVSGTLTAAGSWAEFTSPAGVGGLLQAVGGTLLGIKARRGFQGR